MSTRPAMLLLLLATGCGEAALALRDAEERATEAESAERDSLLSDTGLQPDATWGVGGTLTLTDGAVVPGESALTLETRGVTCKMPATIDAAERMAPEDPRVTALWRLTVTPDEDATCTWVGPAVLRVAFGARDPQLAPAAARAGLSWSEALGLYAGEEIGPLFAVGAAVPRATGPADTDATDTDATAAPADTAAPTDTDTAALPDTDVAPDEASVTLTDGAYTLSTLLGIPLR